MDNSRATVDDDDNGMMDITLAADIKEEVLDDADVDVANVSSRLSDIETDDGDVVIVDAEKTMQYLSGTISFGEFSAVLEQSDPVPHAESSISEAAGVDATDASFTEASSLSITAAPVTTYRKRRYRQLPLTLSGLMGEANIKSARGQYDEAVIMCEYIIRNAPHVPDPFQTLADIYDAKGYTDKRMQCQLIVAHLKQTDAEDWYALGQEFQEMNNIEQALFCYDRVTRLEPGVMDYWLTKYQMLTVHGVTKQLMDCRLHLLSLLPDSAVSDYMEIVRELVKWYNETGDVDKAVSVMMKALEKHSAAVTAGDINVLLDLYFVKARYDKSLLVLIQYCGICLFYADETFLMSNAEHPVSSLPNCKPVRLTVPEDMKIDLKAKLIVSLIHLGYLDCFAELLNEICSENPDAVGDLYLDIAEAYMNVGLYTSAKPILYSLVTSANYNMPAVWLRYAECLNALEDKLGAIDAYEKVVELVPNHFSARVSLSALHQQLGRPDDALRALLPQPLVTAGNEEADLDVRLLMPSCHLLYGQQRFDEFIVCAKHALFSSCKDLTEKPVLRVIIQNRLLRKCYAALQSVVGRNVEKQFKAAATSDRSTITADELWDLYIKLCHVLVDQKKFDIFETIGILALLMPQFMEDHVKAQEAEFMCLTACLLNQNGDFSYTMVRNLCLRNLDNNCVWNVFSQVVVMSQNIRHNRFCLRLAMKHPDHLALSILNGHNAMVAGSYKHAVGEYTASLQQKPDDPLLHFLVGIAYLHLASQKFSSKRHLLVTQACAFLNQYKQLRGECQESYYNLGRAMHQLGLYHAAVYYYQKGLEFPIIIEGDKQELFNLNRDLAFNLRLIYEQSGSYDLAHLLTQQYLVI